MKKSIKVLMTGLSVCLVMGIGAVAYAAWEGNGQSAVTASGSTGQISVIGDVIVTTPNFLEPSDGTGGDGDTIRMQTLYPFDHSDDVLKYWKFTLNAEVVGSGRILFGVKGGLTDDGPVSDSVGALYWTATDPASESFGYDGTRIDRNIASCIDVAESGAHIDIYVYLAAYSVAAMDVDISLTFEASLFSLDDLAWSAVDAPTYTDGDVKIHRLGSGDKWIISYDLYGVGEDVEKWYFGAYVGGLQKLVGLEYASWDKKFASYGYPWSLNKNCPNRKLSANALSVLHSATGSDPANVVFLRDGNRIKALLKVDGGYELLGYADHDMFCLENDDFGLGTRNEFAVPTFASIKYMTGDNNLSIFEKSIKADINATDVKPDKAEHYLGDTVILTADPAPAGKAFAYFTVNGERIAGNSFDVTEFKPYNVNAVYLEPELTYKVEVADHSEYVKISDGAYTVPVATVTDNDGQTLDYEVTTTVVDIADNNYEITDGKIVVPYAGSVCLTITYTAPTLNNEYNTVSIHVTVQSGDTMYAPTSTTLGYIKNADDKTSSFEFVTDKKHGTDEGSVKVAPGEADTGFTVEDFDFTGYDYVEFYAYTEGEGVQAGAYWLGDTALTANEWTKITIDLKDKGVYLKDLEGNTYEPNSPVYVELPYTGRLVLRVMNNAQKSPVWISSVKAGMWPAATITCADSKVTLDKESYRVKDKVILTAVDPEDGYIFSHFTVDGKRIDGNSFVISETTHTVAAVYTEVSNISIAADSGISTEDGKTQYPRGVTVTLEFDDRKTPSGQVFDCFMIDGTTKIVGNTFVTSKATHTVTASFVSTASEMTWATTEYVTPSGTFSTWGKYHKLGSADNWVLSYDVTKTNADSTINGDIPNMWYTGVLFRNNQIVGFHLGDNDGKDGSGNNYVKYFGSAGSGDGTTWEQFNKALNGDMYNAMQAASASNPVKLIFIRQGNKLSVYVKSGDVIYTVLKDFTHAAFDTQYGLDFGYGWRTDCGGTPDIADIQWITGEGKVKLYSDSIEPTA